MSGLVDGLVDVMSGGVVSTVVAAAGAVVALVCLLVVLRMRRSQAAAPHAHTAPPARPRRTRRVRSPQDAAAAPAPSRAPDVDPVDVDGTGAAGAVEPPPGALPAAAADTAPASPDHRASLLPAPAPDGGSSAAFAVAARRDISLLNRQLQTLDELERSETDPDTLQQLFLLDNLTMRLRRGAESLLVLAGSPPGRRVREATPVSDVVRTASAQVEFYERVRVDLTDDPPLAAVHVVPVAHLLAEVLENATAYSPPDAVVDVTGGCDDEAMHVVVRDSGLGMTPEELARAEADLREHDLVVSRTERLGLAVVGRIAARLGVGVVLAARTDGPGTEVTVRLPRELFDVADAVPAVADVDVPVLAEPVYVPAAPEPSATPGGGTPVAPAEPLYVPEAVHGVHAAQPLVAGPRRTSRSRLRAVDDATAAQPAAPPPPAPDLGGYADLPSFDAILTGGVPAVVPDAAPRHGRSDATQVLAVARTPLTGQPATPPPGAFFPEPDREPTPAPASPPAPRPVPPSAPTGWDPGASSWAPDGPGPGLGTAQDPGGWSDEQASLAERASLQQQALSALSSMSSYRPQVSEATGAALLTQRRPSAVDAPLDPAEDAVVRDAEALRARLSAFRAATRLGRETGAALVDHDPRTDPRLAEELR